MKLQFLFILTFLLCTVLAESNSVDTTELEKTEETLSKQIKEPYKNIKEAFHHKVGFIQQYLETEFNLFLKRFIKDVSQVVENKGADVLSTIRLKMDDIQKKSLLSQLRRARLRFQDGRNKMKHQVNNPYICLCASGSGCPHGSPETSNIEIIYTYNPWSLGNKVSHKAYKDTQSLLERYIPQIQGTISNYNFFLNPYKQLFNSLKDNTILMLLYNYPPNQNMKEVSSAYAAIEKYMPKIIQQAKEAFSSSSRITDTKNIDECIIKLEVLLKDAESNQKKMEEVLSSIKKQNGDMDTLLPYLYKYYYWKIKSKRNTEIDNLMKNSLSHESKFITLKNVLSGTLKKEDQILKNIYKSHDKMFSSKDAHITDSYGNLMEDPVKDESYSSDVLKLYDAVSSYYDSSLISLILSELKSALLFLKEKGKVLHERIPDGSKVKIIIKYIPYNKVTEEMLTKLEDAYKMLLTMKTYIEYFKRFSELQQLFDDIEAMQKTYNEARAKLQETLQLMKISQLDETNFATKNAAVLSAIVKNFNTVYNLQECASDIHMKYVNYQ